MDVQYLDLKQGQHENSNCELRFNAIYSFTTEKISAYMITSGKKVLTVCGSGDHALNAILLGASEIIQFDLSSKALFWSEFKIKSIQKLSYQDFVSFMLDREHASVLDYQVYLSIADNLSPEARFYFDQSYKKYNNCGDKLRNSDEFNLNYDLFDLKINSNKYLKSASEYEKLKLKLPLAKISNICCSISNLKAHLSDEKFNEIYLSNISDYAKLIYPDSSNYLSLFVKNEVLPMSKNLEPNGRIFAAYIYAAEEKLLNPRSLIDDTQARRAAFIVKGFEYQEIIFSGVIPNKNDLQVVLRKEC